MRLSRLSLGHLGTRPSQKGNGLACAEFSVACELLHKKIEARANISATYVPFLCVKFGKSAPVRWSFQGFDHFTSCSNYS